METLSIIQAMGPARALRRTVSFLTKDKMLGCNSRWHRSRHCVRIYILINGGYLSLDLSSAGGQLTFWVFNRGQCVRANQHLTLLAKRPHAVNRLWRTGFVHHSSTRIPYSGWKTLRGSTAPQHHRFSLSISLSNWLRAAKALSGYLNLTQRSDLIILFGIGLVGIGLLLEKRLTVKSSSHNDVWF
jgi:hypothetical protein